MNQRQLRKTGDGSVTFYLPEYDEHFHSHHGALGESLHVFIQNGLRQVEQKKLGEISILEMGMGTALNVLLTLVKRQTNTPIQYTALERYPLQAHEYAQLDYSMFPELRESTSLLQKIHTSEWEKAVDIIPNFTLEKRNLSLFDFTESDRYDLVYYDAFAPRVQQELWTQKAFEIVYQSMKTGGLLTTYCVQGEARRAMKSAGFEVEKIPGPPGKREMAWARKV